MKKEMIIIFLIIVIGFMIIVASHPSNCEYQFSQLQPNISDSEYMRIGVNNYLMSLFNNPNFPNPDYDVSLEDVAFYNAMNGKDLWNPTAGNTAEEALKTFISVDKYNCGQASFWIDTNKRDHPNTKYAIGVYKTSYNQYNVSVIIKRYNADTQELNRNGAFITVEHDPSIIDFVPSCYYGKW